MRAGAALTGVEPVPSCDGRPVGRQRRRIGALNASEKIPGEKAPIPTVCGMDVEPLSFTMTLT